MVGEIVVFGGQQGMDEVLWDVGEVDWCLVYFVEFGDQFVVFVVDFEGDLQLDVMQSFY